MAKRRELKRSVSYTTRPPRGSEKNGVDYHFLARSEFLRRRRQGFFLEWANVFGRFYGTSKSACFDLTGRGHDVILTIDVQGMRKIKRAFGRKLKIRTVFIKPPSMSVLEERLRKRRSDSEAEIRKRLRIARREMAAAPEYDYRVVNRRVEDAIRRLDGLFF